MVPIRVAIFLLIEDQVLDQRLAEDAVAGGPSAGNRLVGLAGRSVNHVERTAGDRGDHDRPMSCFGFDLGRARIGVPLGAGYAGTEIVLLEAVDHLAILGMDEWHRAQRGATTKRVVE